MIVAMVEDSEEIVFQRLVAYKAFNIRLLNLQLRWGIAVTNALKLDRMDRLCTTLEDEGQTGGPSCKEDLGVFGWTDEAAPWCGKEVWS